VANTAYGTLEIFQVDSGNTTLGSVIKVSVEPVSIRASPNTQSKW